MLNQVYELLSEGDRERAKLYFSKEIASYLEKHLSEEEKFMRDIGYPLYDNHKKAHDQFRKLMLEVLSKVETGDEKELRLALSLTWGWLYSHILKVDKKYGEFFNSRA